ncbi:unnamed protein product [Camellia sinensis]
MELDKCEETTLHDVNNEEEMRWKQQQAQEAYHEDEDMHVVVLRGCSVRSNDCFMTNVCLGITSPALLHIRNEERKEKLHQGRGWS